MTAITHLAATLGAGAPAPVWLIVEEPAASSDTASGWSLSTILLVLLAIGLLAVVVLQTTRRPLGRPLIRPDELAFQALSRRLLIGRRGRSQLRRLAALLDDASPVALLISERAYRLALNRAPVAGVEVDPALVARLERRVFGAR